ncbi:MAG TPA: hypothetical protein VGJ91_23005, partial [Polyangiaceae bacterium]
MNGLGVGLACIAVLILASCAGEDVDQTPFLGNTGGRAASAGHGGGGGRGGSSASNSAAGSGNASQSGTAGSLAGASFN